MKIIYMPRLEMPALKPYITAFARIVGLRDASRSFSLPQCFSAEASQKAEESKKKSRKVLMARHNRVTG